MKLSIEELLLALNLPSLVAAFMFRKSKPLGNRSHQGVLVLRPSSIFNLEPKDLL
jgi:hypothetical protein